MYSVFFRAFEPEDAVLIHKWRNDFELMKRSIGMNRCTSYQENLKWVTDRMVHDPYNIYWAICLNDESKKMIGYISLNDIHYVNSSAMCGGIVLGDEDCRDGVGWIECHLILFEYVFETLHLNRYYGSALDSQDVTDAAVDLFFLQREGIARQAAFKEGRYHDVIYHSILKDEYFRHKQSGDYQFRSILKRLRELRKRK